MKRVSKLLLRGVDLRSVGHSIQMLWTELDLLNSKIILIIVIVNFVIFRWTSSQLPSMVQDQIAQKAIKVKRVLIDILQFIIAIVIVSSAL